MRKSVATVVIGVLAVFMLLMWRIDASADGGGDENLAPLEPQQPVSVYDGPHSIEIR